MSTSMSVPATVDFVHHQGDTFRRSIAVADSDITAWTWRGEIREAADQGTVIATFTITPVTSKEVEISLAAAVTATLTGSFLYDIEATIAGGDVLTVIAGKFLVRPQVTR